MGLILSNTMSWSYHINEILAKAEKKTLNYAKVKTYPSTSCLDKLYKSMIRPLLDYCDLIYDTCTMYESERLDKLQRKASLLCTGAFRIISNEKVLKGLGWSKLTNRRTNHRFVLFYKILNNLAPQYLKRLCNLTSHNAKNYLLRRLRTLVILFTASTWVDCSFSLPYTLTFFCLYVSVCLSICMSIYVSVCLCISVFVCLCECLSVCLNVLCIYVYCLYCHKCL